MVMGSTLRERRKPLLTRNARNASTQNRSKIINQLTVLVAVLDEAEQRNALLGQGSQCHYLKK